MTLDDYFAEPDAKSPIILAEEVGVSESTLSRIRRGKQNTTRDVILKIIAATGRRVTADALVGVHEMPSTATDYSASATNPDDNICGEAESTLPFPQAPEGGNPPGLSSPASPATFSSTPEPSSSSAVSPSCRCSSGASEAEAA